MKKANVKTDDIAFNRRIWGAIKYYQVMRGISREQLAVQLNVSQRTLHEYEQSAENLTLAKLENFLLSNDINESDFLNIW